jgi:hypothetical protein
VPETKDNYLTRELVELALGRFVAKTERNRSSEDPLVWANISVDYYHAAMCTMALAKHMVGMEWDAIICHLYSDYGRLRTVTWFKEVTGYSLKHSRSLVNLIIVTKDEVLRARNQD